MTATPRVLDIKGLTIGFPDERARQIVPVVRDASFWVGANEMVGLVGESGSGKTQTALAVLGLTREPGRVMSGRVLLDGDDIVGMSDDQLRAVRGTKAAMIFQSPRTSLNPLMTVGQQIGRVYARRGLAKNEAKAATLAILHRVGVAGPERVAGSYPHQLSGGMAQRVMIGMMLACEPKLLIADEPTTGLDATIQAQIFELIQEVRAASGMSVLLITHDLGVVAELCDRVVVMQAGRVVEIAPVTELFANPLHPYTQRLLGSIVHPELDLTSTNTLPPARVVDTDDGEYHAVDVTRWLEANVSAPRLIQIAPGHWVCLHERATLGTVAA